jgi:hypothetical protein
MAVLSELVNTVAKVTGMDAATVALIARHAREAGLIAMSGRGPSAASMRPTDAANLLIAINTVHQASSVGRVIPLYRQCVPYERDAQGNRHVVEGVARLGEIMEQLIRAAGTGIFPDPFLGKQISAQVKDDFAQGNLWIGMKFNVTFIAAALRIVAREAGDGLPNYPLLDSARAVLAFDFFFPTRRRSGVLPKFFRVDFMGNRFEELTIGHYTFRAVGQLIAPIVGEPRDTNC